MTNIIVPVEREDVTAQIKQMHKYIAEANNVSNNSTYKSINFALITLAHARGFYGCLKGLGLLPKDEMVGETIDMVQIKIEDILDEKRRTDMPKWKH